MTVFETSEDVNPKPGTLNPKAKVVAWGSPGDGGDCHSVADRLVAVSEIQAEVKGFRV